MTLQFKIDFEEAGNIDHRLFLRGRALRDEWFPNWEDLENQIDPILTPSRITLLANRNVSSPSVMDTRLGQSLSYSMKK